MIRIEKASASDHLIITELFEQLIKEMVEGTQAQSYFSLSNTSEKCKYFLESGIYKVFMAIDETDGRVVGFLSLCQSHSLYADGSFGIIQEFYVRPDYRSKGVGSKLIDAAQAYGKSNGYSRLEVTTPPLPQFDRTVLFYEQNKFEILGGRKLKFIIR